MSNSPGNDREPDIPPAGQIGSTSTASTGRGKHINSTELFAGAREVLIDHSGETYRLRHTSQGKLILTK